MIVQACINRARAIGFHSNLHLPTDAMISDSVKCVEAGAQWQFEQKATIRIDNFT